MINKATLIRVVTILSIVVILGSTETMPAGTGGRQLPGWYGTVGWAGPPLTLESIGFPNKAALVSMLKAPESSVRKKYGEALAGYLKAFRLFEQGGIEKEAVQLFASHYSTRSKAPAWRAEDLAFAATAYSLSFNPSKPLTERTGSNMGFVVRQANGEAAEPLLAILIISARLTREPESSLRREYRSFAKRFPSNRYVQLAYGEFCAAGSPKDPHWGHNGHYNVDDTGFELREALRVEEGIRKRWPDFAENLYMLSNLLYLFENHKMMVQVASEYVASPEAEPKKRKQMQKIIDYWTGRP